MAHIKQEFCKHGKHLGRQGEAWAMRNCSPVPGQHSAGQPFSQAQHSARAPATSTAPGRHQGRAGKQSGGMERLLCTFLGSLRAGSPCPQLLVLPPSSRTVTHFLYLSKSSLSPDTLTPAVDFLTVSAQAGSWSSAAADSPSLLHELRDRKGLAVLPWGSACPSQHRKHKS